MTRQEMFAVVTAQIREIVDGAKDVEIREDHSLRDLGADSLEIVEVVSRSMKQLKIKVPRTELSGARNVKELLDLFEKSAAAAPSNG